MIVKNYVRFLLFFKSECKYTIPFMKSKIVVVFVAGCKLQVAGSVCVRDREKGEVNHFTRNPQRIIHNTSTH
jgi:hypothetical protein